MMKLYLRTKRGEEFPLVRNPLFVVTNIDGMTRATGSISSVVTGGIDGDDVNNMQAQPRTIIIDLRLNDNVNVEDAKREILHYFKIKQNVTLVWEQNNKTVEISGIIESVNMPRFQHGIVLQVSLHCEQPFWEDIEFAIQRINEAIDLHWFTSDVGGMLYFISDGIALGEIDMTRTRKVYNAGDVAVGMEIEITAYDTVTNPIIYDTDGNFFGVGWGTGNRKIVLQQGDVVRISTKKGSKSVTLNNQNILGYVKPRSTWLQIQAGNNEFSINSEEEEANNMTFSLIYKQRYV